MDRINRIFRTMKELKGMKRGGHCRLIKSSEEKKYRGNEVSREAIMN
jgi:hypothetical protein